METGPTIAIIIAVIIVLMGVMYALYWMGMLSFFEGAASGLMCGSNATGQPIAVTAGFMCCTNTVVTGKSVTGPCGSDSYAKLIGCRTLGATLEGWCCLSTYDKGKGGSCGQCLQGSTGMSCCNSTIGQAMAITGCTFCPQAWTPTSWGWISVLTTICP